MFAMRGAYLFIGKPFGKPFYIYIICVVFLSFPVPSFAADSPFNGAANWGATGLMEIPTARVIEYGKYRVGFTQVNPYRYYYGTISPLPRVEINGRVTEVMGVEAGGGSGVWKDYGNTKDKAVDLKLQIIREGKYWPALAFGIMDPHGTRVYTSQYLVMSKQIYPFDFTLGIGNGRFGRRPISGGHDEFGLEIFTNFNQWCSDAQLFGGVEFAPSKYFSLMVEYNPIRYEKQTGDPAQAKYFTDSVSSRFNYGLRIKPLDWAEIDVSYQRGNQFGVNVYLDFMLGMPLLPIYDLPYLEKAEFVQNPLHQRMSDGLKASGFSDIGILTRNDEIWIQAANNRYYYNARAIGVILKLARQILPDKVQKIYIILIERGIPVVKFYTLRDDLHNFEDGTFNVDEYLTLTEMNTNVYYGPDNMTQSHKQYFSYGIKPEVQAYLNDPSGFIKGRLGVSGYVSLHPWKGASMVAGAAYFPLNDISTSNEPLSIPVRSDLVKYLENKAVLSSLMFEQIGKTKYGIHGKVAAGLLETQYAGLDAEIAVPLFDGRIMAGVSGSLVKKRDPGNPLKLANNDFSDYYDTQFFNARLNLPEVEMAIDVKAGRFLAGDKGARITVSKSFNGIVLSAWYSFTDTSIFSDSFNRGYHDKGVAISIPLRMFLGRDSRTVYSYAVTPWTRDVAQDIAHNTSLFDFIGRNTNLYLNKDREMLQ